MIALDHYSYAYPSRSERSLDDVSLRVRKGEVVLVTGPTGAGKTTLCLAAAGILHHEHGGASSGRVALIGREIAGRYRMDVALLTIDGTGGEELTEFCRKYYNESGYGYGERKDGVLFVVDIGAGSWALHLKGAARELFGEPAKAAVVEAAEARLAAKEYPAALAQFLEDVDGFLAKSVPVWEDMSSGGPGIELLLALAAALVLLTALIHDIVESVRAGKERRKVHR
jgi:energy-coupling factor transporter ATP-binding protein EcfA2